MGDEMMMYSELGFNLLYLAIIWGLVVKMYLRLNKTNAIHGNIPRYFFYAFVLLAFGDTGHVGFRVLAYALGGLDSSIPILGYDLPLVGAGGLSTAITITFFYMFLVAIWKIKFRVKTYGAYFVFQLLGILRLFIMGFPQNEWANVVPTPEWSLYRNIPLMIVGIGLATFILISNKKLKETFYTRLSILIYASYLFYLPVILFVQKIPLLGMLMIPKTIAYVFIAFLVYNKFFKEKVIES